MAAKSLEAGEALAERDRLVLDHLELAYRLRHRARLRRIPLAGMDPGDVLASGFAGLLDAATSYDPSRGDFPMHARTAMLRHLIRDSRQISGPVRLTRHAWEKVAELRGDVPPGRAAGTPRRRETAARARAWAQAAPVAEALDVQPAPPEDPLEGLARSEAAALVHRALDMLGELPGRARQARALRAYHGLDGPPLLTREIAAREGLTRARIQQELAAGRVALRALLEGLGLGGD